jgi:ubiquinone/menaquinone biosynthesis C-methylase UbiE
MSHATTNSHTAGQDDPHNHKHTGNIQTLSLSDRFFAPLDRQVVEWLNLAPGSRVLDAGCGGGGMTRLLAEAVGPGGEVVGLDASPELLEWGKTQAENANLAGRIKFQEGDVRRLPFEDASFDLVWCSRVVHGLNDQLAGVRELARVIRPGGRLVVREGGLPLQFMPYDLGLGAPGLEGRLEVAHAQWFANWRSSLPDVIAYPYGWAHMLREAGLNSVAPRSFLAEFASPLEDYKIEYLKTTLSHHRHDEDSRQLLAAQDVKTLEQLLDAASPHYIFDRDDLHGIVVETIYAGTVLGSADNQSRL